MARGDLISFLMIKHDMDMDTLTATDHDVVSSYKIQQQCDRCIIFPLSLTYSWDAQHTQYL
jgi:hypothetical protein